MTAAPTTAERPALLLVDDRAENLLALEGVLGALGHDMVRASSGEEALRHLLSREFAVIILDVQMPGIDGFETAAQIKERERTSDIPIIVLTAMSREPEHRMRGFASGAVDYIFKPVEPELLRAKVNVFVELYTKNRLLALQREELAHKTVELQRSNADLEQFSYIASHDLQEPLRVIAGYVELLQSHLEDTLDDDARHWIERIETAAGRMSSLLTDLLAYARAGAAEPIVEAVDLDLALRVALDNLAIAIEESGATVRSDRLGTVMATPSELAQIFQNVVGNAVKFRGETAPAVSMRAAKKGDRVVVSVADNGRGVPEDQLERVFGMFERLEGDPFPGTGLGLAMARKLTVRLGGSMWMTKNDGPGVTVHFTVPAVTAQSRRSRAPSRSRAQR
jgi:signal transduction histidine kinase